MQSVQDYLTKVKSESGFGYWNGTYGQIATESLWNQNKARLPDWYNAHGNAKALWMGKRVVDCIGLDKYARWLQPDGSIKYDSKTDLNETMLFDLAKKNGLQNGLISTMPDVPGIMVWKTGHIGIYLGGGISRESQGGDYGVKDYPVKSRPWTHWFYNPYISYTKGENSMEKIIKGSTGILVEKWQRFLKFMGYDIGKFGPNKDGIDGDFGSTGVMVTNEYKKAIGMAEDGTVDIETALNVIERLCEEVSTLQSRIFERNNVIDTQNNQLSDLRVQLESKNSTITDMQSTLTETIAKFETLESENAILLNNSKEHEGEIIDLTQKSELQQIRYAELVKENIAHVQEIDKLNGKILTMQAEIESMRKIKPNEVIVPRQTLAEILRRLFKTK